MDGYKKCPPAVSPMLKRLYTINFIDSFIVGATTVIVPLLMFERGIDLAVIGLVFALAPLAKLAVRIAGSAIVDSSGDRITYVFSSICNFLLSLAYLFSSTAAGFAAGKLLDGARESFIWSAIRPSLMAASPNKKHFAFADLLAGRFVYSAIGSMAVGFLFVIGGFELSLSALVVLSAYLMYSSFRLKNFHCAKARFRLSDFTPFGRSRVFYEAAGAFVAGSLFYNAVFYMLLPLYFSSLGFSLGEIGAFYAGYLALQGVLLHVISHHRVKTRTAALAGVAFYCLGLAGVALGQASLVPLFFLTMAIGDAFLAILWEELNYVVGKASRKRATDLAVVAIPSIFGVMVAAGVSGAAAAAFGFAPIFIAGAVFAALFAAWCLRISGME